LRNWTGPPLIFGLITVSVFLCELQFFAVLFKITSFSVPGVGQFFPLETPNDSPANQANIIKGLTQVKQTYEISKGGIFISFHKHYLGRSCEYLPLEQPAFG